MILTGQSSPRDLFCKRSLGTYLARLLGPVSMEILRPDNQIKLYILILFCSCNFLVMILSTVCLVPPPLEPQVLRIIPFTIPTIHPQGLCCVGKELLLPHPLLACPRNQLSRECCFLRKSLLGFVVNSLPSSAHWLLQISSTISGVTFTRGT